MTLRLEYYIMDDGTARIITYVNDRLLEDTNLYYTKSSKLDNLARTEITRVRLQAYSSTDAEILVDNVKFTYSDTAYTAPTPPEPEPEPDPEPDPDPQPPVEDDPTPETPGAGWDDEIEVDSDILDFDNDGGSGTIDNSAWSD
jgi:hypothetical protein